MRKCVRPKLQLIIFFECTSFLSSNVFYMRACKHELRWCGLYGTITCGSAYKVVCTKNLVNIHSCKCAYIHICIRTYIHTYTCVYIYIYIYNAVWRGCVFDHRCMHARLQKNPRRRTFVYLCIHKLIFTQSRAFAMYVYIYVYLPMCMLGEYCGS